MNLVNEENNVLYEVLRKAAESSLPSVKEGCDCCAWTVELDAAAPGDCRQTEHSFNRCSNVELAQSLPAAVERCRTVVRAGKGYDSEVFESSSDGTAAICLTVTKDCIARYYVYVAMRCCSDAARENIESAQRIVPHLDAGIHSLGVGWNIGGAIPKDYRRIEEDVWP